MINRRKACTVQKINENIKIANMHYLMFPGESFVYSNFGYVLLGKIIEVVSGLTYEQFVQASILQPAGVLKARVGGNSMGDALPNEVCTQ